MRSLISLHLTFVLTYMGKLESQSSNGTFKTHMTSSCHYAPNQQSCCSQHPCIHPMRQQATCFGGYLSFSKVVSCAPCQRNEQSDIVLSRSLLADCADSSRDKFQKSLQQQYHCQHCHLVNWQRKQISGNIPRSKGHRLQLTLEISAPSAS